MTKKFGKLIFLKQIQPNAKLLTNLFLGTYFWKKQQM